HAVLARELKLLWPQHAERELVLRRRRRSGLRRVGRGRRRRRPGWRERPRAVADRREARIVDRRRLAHGLRARRRALVLERELLLVRIEVAVREDQHLDLELR